jgi:hypothetical protein
MSKSLRKYLILKQFGQFSLDINPVVNICLGDGEVNMSFILSFQIHVLPVLFFYISNSPALEILKDKKCSMAKPFFNTYWILYTNLAHFDQVPIEMLTFDWLL